MNRRAAFTLIELLIVMAILGVLVTMLVPVVTGQIEEARRTRCQANLRAIGQKMVEYAHDNKGRLPAFSSTHAYWHAIGHNRALAEGNSIADNARVMFKLIELEYVDVDAMVCPSTGDTPDPLAENPQHSFASWTHISYSFQNQKLEDSGIYTARPTSLLDPGGKAIMADRSPLFTLDPDTPETYDRMIPTGEPLGSNSHNHDDEGQNVLFLDGSVSFRESPSVGIANDNIYTRQTGTSHVEPINNDRPYSQEDSELVP